MSASMEIEGFFRSDCKVITEERACDASISQS